MIASHFPFQAIRTESSFLLTVSPPTLRKARTDPQFWSINVAEVNRRGYRNTKVEDCSEKEREGERTEKKRM